MDKVQYKKLAGLMSADFSEADFELSLKELLGVDVTDPNQAKALKERIIGTDTIMVTTADGNTTVEFGGVAATSVTFARAFISALLNVIALRAIDSFLPEPKVEKTKSGSKRDGNGSPAPKREIPLRHKGNY